MNKKILVLLVFALVGSILIGGVYAQNGTTSTTPASSSAPICPSVCIPMWKLDGSVCQYTDCGSGCGPDSITTFKTEEECKSKTVTTTPSSTAIASSTSTPVPSTIITGKCTEDDNGINIVKKGVTIDSTGSYTDYCVDNSLVEYFCDGSTAKRASYDPSGYPCTDYGSVNCADGRCVTPNEMHYCDDKTDNDNDGATDCNDSDCSSSYSCSTAGKCSKYQPWNCYDKTTCVNAGALWCSEPSGPKQWCSDKCPTFTCSSPEPWNCKTETDCISSGLKWCKYQWGDAKCDFICPEIAKPACPIVTTGVPCKYGEEESVPTFDNNGCQTGNYCKPINICPNEWKPICGENGVTYQNLCKAKIFGVGIKHEGECGTKTICDDKMIEEKYRKCQMEKGIPEKFTRPNGCTDIFCKYENVKPPVPQPPSECTGEKDPVTGFISYKCATRSGTPTCPQMREEDRRYAKDNCYAYGGTPDYRKTAEGCEYLDCNFESKKQAFEVAECLAENQVKEIENKCNSIGLKTVFKISTIKEKDGIEKSCKVARCIEPPRSDGCPTSLPPESKIVCPQGAMETVGIDERGCNILKCVTKEEKDCPQPPPKEAFLKCEEKGGRMIVKQDDRGCARFFECVSGRDEDIYVEKVKKIPETMEVLQFALKLEGMKISLDIFIKKIDKIADYYKTKSPSDYEKYKRVQALLSTAVDTLENVKIEMREKINTLTTDDIETFKYRIREIKQIFKKILFVLLGGEEAKEEFSKVEDCGTSSECMENAFKLCKPAKISQPGGQLSEIAIVGLEGDKCVLKWTAGAEFMTCKFENYALGTKSIGQDIEKYCEGPLVIKLSKMTTATKIQRVGEPRRPESVNSVVSAVKLTSDPNDYRYVFTATDPEGVKEFSITKSNFDGILIFSSYGSPDDKCVKEAKSKEIKLSPKDFPLTVSVDDCGQQVFKHEMKMDSSLKTELLLPNQPASPETIEQPLAQKPGSTVSGVKLSSDPNDLRYSFTAHDADGIKDFYIEKKNFDNVYVKIDPPCAKEATEELKFNPSELPNPFKATVMDCGTPGTRSELKVYMGIPEQLTTVERAVPQIPAPVATLQQPI
ncbi:MAG TPA: Kazal-type serine protease inhibitor family protein [archaeon]|nr:Kazal-type serine protease inhibitor family protein [archaeon]